MRRGRARAWVAVLAAVALAGCSGSWPGGVGAVLRFRQREGVLVLSDVPARGAAARAGLRAGDVVVAIDGAPVAGLTLAQVVEKLRGQVGTRVVLRVRRGIVARDFTVERAPYRGSQL